ncbi:hypothetical protein FKR81_18830 [Lentzea tibetensis]|uniref:Uncharacterized protein n=1 Tax=Lentzea tibetensis TaxID=2591470 RepID=A0A563ESL9_9PSEU|nr:hypothetical protein [Lentzea tibetensis]TWP50669.1 hypothetical protein FKR81_18830 [Lentzea tibetensis]
MKIPSTAVARLFVLLALVLGATVLQAADGASEPMPTVFTAFCDTSTAVVHHLPHDVPGLPMDPSSVLEACLFAFVLVLIGFVAFKRYDLLFTRPARGPSRTGEAHFQVPQLAQLCVLRT